MTDTKVMKCVHCGKQSVFQVRAEGTQYGASLPKDPYNIDYEATTITTWRVLECALCFKPTTGEKARTPCRPQCLDSLTPDASRAGPAALDSHKPTLARGSSAAPG